MNFRNKEREYLKDKINVFATNKNIRDVYRGIRGSLDRVVGIATGYGLTTEGSEFEFLYGQEFRLLHVVQTGS
jgi:hypothetical protein